MTKRTISRRLGLTFGTALSILCLAAGPAGALSTPASSTATGDQAKISRIINRGNSEIQRRLATLQGLGAKIGSTAKLSAADKVALSSEVTAESNDLMSLKTKLDADTTVADARTDAQSIITGYRVYALIVPKVNLIVTADAQQVAESKLSALATKLQSRLDAAKTAGKNVTALENGLSDMNSQLGKAQAASSSVEAAVIGLQPSDFNSDHTVLSGYRDQLKTAQTEIQAAVSDAKSIITGLKNL